MISDKCGICVLGKLLQRLLNHREASLEPHAEQAHCSRPTLPPTLTCDTAAVPTLSFSPRDLDHFHPPRCQPSVARRCVDLSPVATIRDENREAAPRPRHCGVLNRTHTRARSLAKMSAGISNPCCYIDQQARARWPQPASGTTITVVPQYESQATGPSSQSQGARRRRAGDGCRNMNCP